MTSKAVDFMAGLPCAGCMVYREAAFDYRANHLKSIAASSRLQRNRLRGNELRSSITGKPIDRLEAEVQLGCSRNGRSAARRPSAYQTHAVVKRSPKRLKYASMGVKKANEPLMLELDPSGADATRLHTIADMIKEGAVGIIPTDTVYAIVCDLKNRAAIDRLYRIKDMDPKKPLSILCRSFKDIDTYTLGFPRGNSGGQTNVFRAARGCFPGPYTFILKASKDMPKQCMTFGSSAVTHCAPRRSVGVRMPDDAICQALLALLDEPLLCTSVTQQSEQEWLLDPAVIAEMYGGSDRSERVDFIVDGGVRVAEPSSVIDMTGDRAVVLRQGKGVLEDWMLMLAQDSTDSFVRANPYAN